MNPFTAGDYVTTADGTKYRVINVGVSTLDVNLAGGGINAPTITLQQSDVQAYVPQP